ncbi:hypothetical protein B4U37_01735 [Sutcliffiella horikoshii]|uniref:HNH endonuclease n=1 Tax=Sutcliffiella horikoshii TaxID=79883 RepID=A0ABN4ZGM9_9BACI|nr:hypothetical protein [Sutcliffiella horikoshii]ART74846.1 hypothetical protein B4U37_01735 [Sutcliffiella horikoshii]
MARKPKVITHLMNNGERQLCKALWRTGVITEKDALKHFGVSEERRGYGITDKRWNLMLKDGVLKKQGQYVFLGDKGDNYLRNKMGMTNKYNSKIEHIKHDLKLNKCYLEFSETQRETWKTETEIRSKLSSQQKYHDMYYDSRFDDSTRKNFIPDATYYSEELQQEVALEVVTSSYSDMDIAMKRETANRFYNGHFYQI